MVCTLCGTPGARAVLSLGEWRILRCAGCGLGWLDPRPEPSLLGELYDEAYFTRQGIMTAESDEQMAAKIAGQSSRVRFVQKFKPSGRLLDVGCASGHFLARAREAGYEVRGLEVSDWAVSEGRKRLGLDIVHGTIETAGFAGSAFDAVTMWHVLEHFDDPVASLRKVRDWLESHGVLVLECPNSGSFDAAKYGSEWAGWRIPYHFWHFTPKSLKLILERSGFAVQSVSTLRSQWMKEHMKRIPVLDFARNLIASFVSGRDMRVVAGPVKSHE